MKTLNKQYLEIFGYMHNEKEKEFIEAADLQIVGTDLYIYDPWNELGITETLADPSWKVLYPDWAPEK